VARLNCTQQDCAFAATPAKRIPAGDLPDIAMPCSSATAAAAAPVGLSVNSPFITVVRAFISARF
jgi:hypothetical protein